MDAMKARRFCCLLLAMALIAPGSLASDFDFAGMSNAQLIAIDDQLADIMISRGLYAYVSPSGKKYHTKPTCSNMQSTMRVPVADLEECGYEPCKRCYKKEENKK